MTRDFRVPPLAKPLRGRKPASESTRAANAAVLKELDFSDRQSFADAQRGFIASLEPPTIPHFHAARPAYDLTRMKFLDGEAPETVNPSLWRQAQLNAQHHGLYEVVPGIYQVRSLDVANMTLIRGDSGWVIIDPLTAAESSRAALELANRQLGEREVRAVIITHSHADHFAGIFGVITPEQAASGEVPILAPEGFVQEALSENVLAGNVMGRRATYMFGNLLPPAPDAFVTTGLGAALALGTTGFAEPNDLVRKTGESRVLDGVELEFQLTPDSEAPAEMVFYFPQFKALCMAEITSHHLHNVYTPRGAQVRDALAWSAQIQESIDLFGARLEVQFASHHWPIWGRERAVEYLSRQRDLYKFIHDQTLRLANHGYTKEEIAELVRLPDSLGKPFYNRGYYGTLHHNVRAVYVRYLGYFDGNPAHLFPLPPLPAARRYLAFMGGAKRVVEKAEACMEAGDYRWIVEVLNHVVMAEPHHEEARSLLADALEQLGYQAESAPWRNFFLSGALELREGLPRGSTYTPSEAMARNLPLENLFQVLAMRLNPEAADGLAMHFNMQFTDAEPTLLSIEHSVLHAFPGRIHPEPTASLRISSVDFKRLMMRFVTAQELLEAGALELEGELMAFARLGGLFDSFERRFPLVAPRAF